MTGEFFHTINEPNSSIDEEDLITVSGVPYKVHKDDLKFKWTGDATMHNRFKLEEQIMSCWNIVDDIKLARDRFIFSDKEDNYFLGLQSIYQEKFEYLQEIMEELIYAGKLQ